MSLICERWMRDTPCYDLMVGIGNVYNFQVLGGYCTAAASLNCFFTVHDLVAQTVPMDTTIPTCGSKRKRDGRSATHESAKKGCSGW